MEEVKEQEEKNEEEKNLYKFDFLTLRDNPFDLNQILFNRLRESKVGINKKIITNIDKKNYDKYAKLFDQTFTLSDKNGYDYNYYKSIFKIDNNANNIIVKYNANEIDNDWKKPNGQIKNGQINNIFFVRMGTIIDQKLDTLNLKKNFIKNKLSQEIITGKVFKININDIHGIRDTNESKNKKIPPTPSSTKQPLIPNNLTKSGTFEVENLLKQKIETKDIFNPLFKIEKVIINLSNKNFNYFNNDEEILKNFINKYKTTFKAINLTNINLPNDIIIVYDISKKTFSNPKDIKLENKNIYFIIQNDNLSFLDPLLKDKFLTEDLNDKILTDKLIKLKGNNFFIIYEDLASFKVFELIKK